VPPDGLILTSPGPAGRRDQRRDQLIYHQYRADQARRKLRGVDEQIAKAERTVAGKAPVKRIRFIAVHRADKSVNRTLEAKARTLAVWKGYSTTSPRAPTAPPVTAEFVIGAYHRLYQIEASFRMSKHDLAARPIYHHKRESIEAHLTIVFAALVVGRLVEEQTGSVNPPVRAHRPPLPHRPDPRRTADPHRRGPTPSRSPRGAHVDHRVRGCALTRKSQPAVGHAREPAPGRPLTDPLTERNQLISSKTMTRIGCMVDAHTTVVENLVGVGRSGERWPTKAPTWIWTIMSISTAWTR
jgi:hypothetical protein